MSAVLGIDFSSFAVDLVRLDEETNAATWTRVDLPGGTAFDRLRQVRAGMPTASFYTDVYLCGIEVAFGRGQGRTQAVLQRVYGAVIACLPPGLQVWEVHSTEWRKALGLAGNASKADCAKKVRSMMAVSLRPNGPGLRDTIVINYSHESKDWPQDALDAYAIAYSIREQNARAVAGQLEQGAA